MKALLALCLIFSGMEAQAFTGLISENFSTTTYMDASNTTAVWNIYFKMIHPPLVASTTSYVTNSEDYPISVGTGSDGVFGPSTYANFSVGGVVTGGIITIDTTVHPVLNFTSFYLDGAHTIEGTGANPLIIRVLGTFTNLGTIDCSGGAGQSVSASISTTPQGGTARCGGGSGGNGGATGVSPGTGVCAGCNGGGLTNGPGLPSTGNTNALNVYPTGGGGGGGYGPGTTATSGAGGGGAAGACTNSPYATEIGSAAGGPGGGSGGGGGGAYLNADSQQSGGAGGGGGGGAIVITVVGNVDNEGSILAKGGAGGNATAGLGGSAGGGGGGGTIILQTAGTFIDNGFIEADLGANGVGSGSAQAGGTGCNGRGWLFGPTGYSTLGGSAVESPGFGAPDPGQVHYISSTAVTAQSLSYDALNTSPTYLSLALTDSLPNASTASVFVAGSSDNFVNDNSGFLPLASISSINGKRYFKFKLSLQLDPAGAEATTPATVSTLTVNLNGVKQSQFQFNSACGTFGGPGEFIFFLASCLLGGLLTTGRLRRRIPFRRATSLNQY